MTSAKLTNWDRDIIINAAVKRAFDPREASLSADEAKLAQEAYDFIFPAFEQRVVAKVPANWIRRDACLNFNVGGQRITLCVAGEGLPVPYQNKGTTSGSYHCRDIGAIPAGELCDRVQAHALAKDNLRKERETAKSAVKALVYSVSTTGKLREIWPEGEEFYAGLERREDRPRVPAVQVAQVNAMLGLAA